MAFLDNFPYTNIHELNLDWILRVLKAMGVKIDEYTDKVDELTDEVNNFIQNADIPGTVREVLLEMYEDGRLADLVSAAVVAISDKVTYYFTGGGTQGTGGSHGTAIWADTADGAIIMDFGWSANGLLASMQAHDVTKVRAIILSHYHDDHVGGTDLSGFYNVMRWAGFDFSECVAYLPHGLIEWDRMQGDSFQFEQDAEAAIKTELAAHGMTAQNNRMIEPVEGQRVDMGNLSLRFFNLSANYFADYYGYTLGSEGNDRGVTTYNNFSMITVIDHYSGYKFIYPADAHEPAEANNYRAWEGCDIVVSSHHCLNRQHAYKMIEAMNPEVFIISSGSTYYPLVMLQHMDYAQAVAQGAQAINTFVCDGVKVEDSARSLKTAPENEAGEYWGGMPSPYFYAGQAWRGDTLSIDPWAVSDLNTITYPSVFSAQNAEAAQALSNVPFTNSGFWLITREVGNNHTILQEAYSIGTDYYMRAYRRARWVSENRTHVWDEQGWHYDSAALYPPFRHALVAGDFTAGGTITLGTGVNENVASEENDVICIGMNFTPSASISAGTSFLKVTGMPRGQGCYGALFTEAGDVYPVSMRYDNTGTTVRAERTIPANAHVYGTLVCMRKPTA